MADAHGEPAVPRTFWEYLRSMGPGIVVALTWLGAGDLVDSAVSGGNYGYALMWALALALFVRFMFVSIMTKYQLCNQHGESLMAGFKRIHPWLPLLVGLIALLFGHIYGSFLVKGAGEAVAKIIDEGMRFVGQETEIVEEGVLAQTGIKKILRAPWMWSTVWVILAGMIVWRGVFQRIEKLFYVFLGLLSVSLIGVALWTGPNVSGIVQGAFLFALPEKEKSLSSLLIAISIIGAVGGSVGSLSYPYFVQQKGWKGPKFRRLQLYDLAFGTIVIIVLNLSVWTIGAELIEPAGKEIKTLEDLAGLLTTTLGTLGAPIFYLGVFAAVASSVVGNATGFGYMWSDALRVCRSDRHQEKDDQRLGGSAAYNTAAAWVVFSPLPWSFSDSGFILLTVVGNAASVIVLPVLAAAVWLVTSQSRCIGETYRNKWWEHASMAVLTVIAVWGAYKSTVEIRKKLMEPVTETSMTDYHERQVGNLARDRETLAIGPREVTAPTSWCGAVMLSLIHDGQRPGRSTLMPRSTKSSQSPVSSKDPTPTRPQVNLLSLAVITGWVMSSK